MILSEVMHKTYSDTNFLKADIILALEKIRDECDLNPIKTARKVIEILSEDLSAVVNEKVYKTDCKLHCFHCCAQEVSVTLIELMLILSYIFDNFSKEETEQLIQRLENTVKRIENGEKFFCGFLFENKCTIHSVRPINCATYFSNDVNYCIAHDGAAKKLRGNPIHYVLGEQIVEFYRRYFSRLYELNHAMLKLLKQENIKEFTISDIIKCLN